MGFFKLEKLKIEAFDRVERSGLAKKTFTAMFNPASYQMSHGVMYSSKRGINTSGSMARYIRSEPAKLDLDLLIDGTGVHTMGLMALFGTKTVAEQVTDFRQTAFEYAGDIHQPNFLVISWGQLWFSCRLESCEVKYDLFDRGGLPLRATISAKFSADEDDQKRNLRENKSSPDLTHRRLVQRGDTLPLLCRDIYGSSNHYLQVARVNGLDHFRRLDAGQQLIFSPLAELLAEEPPQSPRPSP